MIYPSTKYGPYSFLFSDELLCIIRDLRGVTKLIPCSNEPSLPNVGEAPRYRYMYVHIAVLDLGNLQMTTPTAVPK